jgi:hypothetical protein
MKLLAFFLAFLLLTPMSMGVEIYPLNNTEPIQKQQPSQPSNAKECNCDLYLWVYIFVAVIAVLSVILGYKLLFSY